MLKSEAEARLAVILKPFNVDSGFPEKPVYTFKVYVEEVFLSVMRRKWKESTRMTTEPRITVHLVTAFQRAPAKTDHSGTNARGH